MMTYAWRRFPADGYARLLRVREVLKEMHG